MRTERLTPSREGIDRAAALLAAGEVVAFPTETVYGLGGDARNGRAVARIYAAKGRPDFNPLIVHVRDAAQAAEYADWLPDAELAAMIHWPGPLTLVLPRRDNGVLADAVTAGLPTVALRVPAHPVMQALLALLDFPLAAPSANRSGYISPTTAQHVLASLDGRVDLVLDAGPTSAGVESTILAIDRDGGWRELRPGPVDSDALHRHYFDCGLPAAGDQGRIEAPGQLASHYAPGKPVRLNALVAEEGEFLIGFGAVAGHCTLSADGNVIEAAARLYACLHEAARARQPRIAVAPVPDDGVGRAINDRLRRAAAPTD